MVNLLPTNVRARVAGEYNRRRIAVGAYSLAVGLFFCAGCLVPLMLLSDAEQDALQSQAAILDTSIARESLSDAARAEASTTALYQAVKKTIALPQPSVLIDGVFALPRAGISLRHADFSVPDGTPTIRISGIADTRDHLLAFKQAIAELPEVADANLPVDALAASTDIAFGMTVTYRAPKTAAR